MYKLMQKHGERRVVAGVSPFELKRQQQIASNKRKLRELQLDGGIQLPEEEKRPAKAGKKRKEKLDALVKTLPRRVSARRGPQRAPKQAAATDFW